ncbi:MAG: hypothetical protein JXD19_06470, partial [Deltaproteobacteria bacterium]|nr:hypothetical protein [Deltaproteobacteria bacterium]
GRSAEDVRIRGKEIHQFGKGDDPGGHVRDDLDSSGRDCAFCHSTGKRGAPVARHSWLPPLHLDTIACQTCHIPERAVKAALVQAGDVLNPGAKIPTKGKHLWVFYGPDMRSWNHYGELEMMGYDDKPTDPYQPVLARYQGKIYPVNRVHSSWPAIKTEGEEGLMQPRMGDIYKMWIAHQKDSAAYPRLADIRDDNGDEVPEINRPEEIEALIASVTKMLADIRYPMEGKKVVWVMNDRIYSSGADFEPVLKHSWEASPYGNVHKYNHDVYPAKAALGVNGCIDCHNLSSAVFFADILKYPFSEEGEPVTVPQYEILEISGLSAGIGALRETYGKPILYGLLVALLLSFAVLVGELIIAKTSPKECRLNLSLGLWFVGVAVGVTIIAVGSTASLADYVLPSRFWLDANHFLFSLFIILMGITALSWEIIRSAKRELREGLVLLQPRIIILVVGLSAGIASGLLMLLKLPGLEMMTRASYTTFDASLMLILIGCVFLLLREALKWTIEGEK